MDKESGCCCCSCCYLGMELVFEDFGLGRRFFQGNGSGCLCVEDFGFLLVGLVLLADRGLLEGGGELLMEL